MEAELTAVIALLEAAKWLKGRLVLGVDNMSVVAGLRNRTQPKLAGNARQHWRRALHLLGRLKRNGLEVTVHQSTAIKGTKRRTDQ